MCEYHSVKEGGDSWTFQVKNMYNPNRPVDLSNEAIMITLDGIYIIESTSINGNTRYSETLERADEKLGELSLRVTSHHWSYLHQLKRLHSDNLQAK